MKRKIVFFNTQINPSEKTAYTPVVDDDFRGIKIGAPEKIELNGEVPFVLSGVMQLNSRYRFQFHSPSNELTIIVENCTHKQLWSGNLFLGGNIPERNPDMTIKDIHPKAVSTEWFNVDLFNYIRDMPRLAGEYIVYATLGDYTSNSVIVKLEGKFNHIYKNTIEYKNYF